MVGITQRGQICFQAIDCALDIVRLLMQDNGDNVIRRMKVIFPKVSSFVYKAAKHLFSQCKPSCLYLSSLSHDLCPGKKNGAGSPRRFGGPRPFGQPLSVARYWLKDTVKKRICQGFSEKSYTLEALVALFEWVFVEACVIGTQKTEPPEHSCAREKSHVQNHQRDPAPGGRVCIIIAQNSWRPGPSIVRKRGIASPGPIGLEGIE